MNRPQHDLIPKILKTHIKAHSGIHCICTSCTKCGECILCNDCDCVGGSGLLLNPDCDGLDLQEREANHA